MIGILYDHENMVVQVQSGVLIADQVKQYYSGSGYAVINNNNIVKDE